MPEAEPSPLRVFERVSKAATAVSVFLIVALQLALHPDLTMVVGGVGAAAFVVGWLGGRSGAARTLALWLVVAPLAPALFHILTGREGPILDLVWMAGLAGSLLGASNWVRWNLPVLWRILLGGWALTISLAWPVLVFREAGFDLRGLHDFGAINSWAMLSAPRVVAWIAYVVLTQLLGVLWLDWLVGCFNRSERTPRVVDGLWIGATIASLVALYQGTVDLSFLSTTAWASLGRATGTMLDANAYGVLAALAGPLAFVVLRSTAHRWTNAASIVVLAVNLLGMWMSGSRTALLCAIAGGVALAISAFRAGPRLVSRRLTIATATVIVVLIVSGATAVGPWKRLIDVPLTKAGAALAWSRGPYGPIAMQMAREYPLSGVGVGSYYHLAPDYWRVEANNLLPFDNAQNWWRHQAAELGLLGALPLIVWSILIGWRVVAGRSRADAATAITVRGLLLGLGVISLLGMPTQNPVVLLWFFFLVAWLNWLTEAGRVERAASQWTSIASVIVMVMAIGYASTQLVLGRGSLGVAERAKRTQRDYVFGAYEPEPLPNGAQFRWTDDESRFTWAAKTRWLVVRVWALHPDIVSRPVHVTLATSCQTLFDEELRSTEPISIGLELPERAPRLDVTVHVSRTWRPSDHGADDTRALGAAILADFSNSREQGLAQNRAVEVTDCR